MLIGHIPCSLLCPKVYKHIFPLHIEKEINQLINESINRFPPSCSTIFTATFLESTIIVTSCSPLCPTQPFYKGPCPGCRGHRALRHQVTKPTRSPNPMNRYLPVIAEALYNVSSLLPESLLSQFQGHCFLLSFLLRLWSLLPRLLKCLLWFVWISPSWFLFL